MFRGRTAPQQPALARTEGAGDGDDFAGAELEVKGSRTGNQLCALDGRDDRRGRALPVMDNGFQCSADHGGNSRREIDRPGKGTDDAAAAHDDGAVGDRGKVAKPMRDVEDCHAGRAQPADDGEQPVGFRGRQARCRLVEDQDGGLGRDTACDGDQLAFGRAQIGKVAVERQVEIDQRCDLSRALADRPV